MHRKPNPLDIDRKGTEVRKTAAAALCCAGIAAGAYITIPIGTVPFTLQTLFVLLTGLLLRPTWATAAVAAYLLMGSVGLPIFAAGSGGIGHLFGPTGGYLWGFLPAVGLVSLIAGHGLPTTSPADRALIGLRLIAALLTGTAVIYAAGVFQLGLLQEMPLPELLAAGVAPFLIGDAVKMAAAAACAGAIRPILQRRGLV